jgi:phosphoglycolate phosphatase
VPAEANLLKYVGPPLRDAFCELLAVGMDDDRVAEAIVAYRDRFSSVGMFENAVYAGVPYVLAELSSRNATLFVATSKPRVYAKQILEHFGLAGHFSEIYGSELDGTRSNKDELIAHVLSASGLRAQDTIMVGDRHHDIAGALRCSVFPVGVLWGYGSRVELAEAGAQKLIDAPEELLRLVA